MTSYVTIQATCVSAALMEATARSWRTIAGPGMRSAQATGSASVATATATLVRLHSCSHIQRNLKSNAQINFFQVTSGHTAAVSWMM